MARILIADDEAGIREFLTDALALDGHEVDAASDGEEAARRVDAASYDLVITDLRMPKRDGMTLVRKLRAEQPEVEVIVLTAHGTVATAVEALKLGAFDYLQKPLGGPDELSILVGRALERRGLVDAHDRAERTRAGVPRLSYGDAAMQPVVQAIDKVAPTNASVLLLGESGTGKEVAARVIHEQSQRRRGPFMAVNCAALAENLLESELFGHEKGAFTGATDRKRGRVELAHGGTFLLDEVGELKPELQAKLLRVIQERRFERLGGTRPIQVDVRWIAATNRDLQAMIADGRFREDLYHRLAVFPVRLPALRERPGDIVPLARVLLEEVRTRAHRRRLELHEAAAAKLVTWHWPGNVRELSNVLERASILAEGSEIRPEHLWLEVGEGGTPPPAAGPAAIRPLADLERDAIEAALRAVGGNRRRAAELLGIGERTLYDKLKRYSIE